MHPVVALHPPFRLRRTGGNNAYLQSFTHASKLRRGRLPTQSLAFRWLSLINILPIRVQRPGYAILSDPTPQHSYRCPDRFLFSHPARCGSGGVIHHIHQTAAWAALLKPGMETAIQLHPGPKMLPPEASGAEGRPWRPGAIGWEVPSLV